MLITGIKSKPIYEPLRADIGGRYHLMLACGPGGEALLRVLGEIRDAAPRALQNTRVLLVLDADGTAAAETTASVAAKATHGTAATTASTTNHAATATAAAITTTASIATASSVVARIQDMGVREVRVFGDTAALLATFRTVLEESLMGTRLYVAGPESFIGVAMQLALEFDLNQDEIRAEELGTLARRVHCVHCRTTGEQVKTNIVRCGGCGRWLLVRDHYSRRLAAYMGVMVDAEAPGELPPVKEVYL